MYDRFLYDATTAFLLLLNGSIMAGWMILAVLAVRLLIRRASKKYLAVLWLLVGIRLVLPISFRVPFSLIPSSETIPINIARAATPAISSGVSLIDSAVNPVLKAHLSATPLDDTTPVAKILIVSTFVWIAGMIALLMFSAITYLVTRGQVRTAVLVSNKDRLYACDEVQTPFILGLRKPRIYIPSSLDAETVYHVKRHEFVHLTRRDQWRKLGGVLLLSVYWFNPLIWAAFLLFCRDMETACDEEVICGMDKAERAAYVNSLLACAKPHPTAVFRPGFGEVAVKTRVKRILGYRQTLPWMNVVAGALCVVLAVGYLTLPRKLSHTFYQYSEDGLIDEDGVYLPIGSSAWRLITGCPLYVGAYRNIYDGDVSIYAADPSKRVIAAEAHDAYSIQGGPMLRQNVVLPDIADESITVILSRNKCGGNGRSRTPLNGVFLSSDAKADLLSAFRRIENGEGDDTWHEWVRSSAYVYLWYPEYPEMIRFYGKETELDEHVRSYHSSIIVIDAFDNAMYFTSIDYSAYSIEIPQDCALYREVTAFFAESNDK